MNKSHFQMMARYGAWANKRLAGACQSLSTEAYHKERGAFFGSIHGTLNHILAGDRIWFGRITGIDSGITSLDAQLFDTFDDLSQARENEDLRIQTIIDEMTDQAYSGMLAYSLIVAPEPMNTPMSQVLTHVFNHATHHRGQVHTLLSQAAGDPPPLDLMYFLREA